ncbi:MAG: pectate lyase-like adhesive domain-containing protein, partial [Xanthobacteraceae bacterium]
MTTPTQTFNVGSQAALNSAIETIDQDGSGNFTINLTGDISVSPDGDPQGLYAIDTGATVTINGNGFTLQGTGQAAVDGGSTDTGLAVLAGKVTIQNLTIEDTNAKGGDGSGSGGGGAGLGGGLFVGSNASVTLDDVNFQKDQAQGGNGGSGVGGGGAGGNASILVPNLGGAGPDGADGEDGEDGEKGANGSGAAGGDGGSGAAGSMGGTGGFGGDG